MSEDNERAILHIETLTCECGHVWNEQTIIFRSGTSYSYEVSNSRYRKLVDRELKIEGTRSANRQVPICYRCCQAPNREMGWGDGETHRWHEDYRSLDRPPRPDGPSPSKKKQPSDDKAKEEIDKLFDL